jgi:hypothetical protein
VTEYIEKQISPQREILNKLRTIFQSTLTQCDEKMAWGVPTYSGGKFYIASMRQRVHVGFAISGLDEVEIKHFEGSGKIMRHIKIPTLEEINERKLVMLIKLVEEKVTCKKC